MAIMNRIKPIAVLFLSVVTAGIIGWQATKQDRRFPAQPGENSRHPVSRHPVSRHPVIANAAQRIQENQANSIKRYEASDEVAEGRDLLLNYRFLPKDFRQSTFEELWKDWPEPYRAQAKEATPEQRIKMAFRRYGFSPRKDDPAKPMQYVVGKDGWWAMNCFACHGGTVNGKFVEGLPNSHLALQTLYDDLRRTKRRLGIPAGQMESGSLIVPMGGSTGTSNAVIFGIVLMAFRDKDLNIKPVTPRPFLIHHDMDAPAWWNVKKRERLYLDGFVEKGHRALIPFVMDQRNSGEKMRGWEDEFKKVYKYIESLESPKYPFEINRELAQVGKQVFVDNCSSCHGTYGKNASYPSKIVDLKKIGTDPVRFKALTKYDRKIYQESWFADYGKDKTVVDPNGYQAPPLDGIWASAPYFHNGSVPTLHGVLNPKQRPAIWKRHHEKYDTKKVGIVVEAFDALPKTARRVDEKRTYFDSNKRGKSAEGHPFADTLSKDEKQALLEYLKTL